MPSDDRALTRAARERAATTGENYTTARAALLAEHATSTATIDPALLVPYPDEDDVRIEELGWRALPADATAQQRARAEAIWRPVGPDRPCRCSGQCNHGEPCRYDDCVGPLVHVDRYPGSFFATTVWEDSHECAGCDSTYLSSVALPDVPWAEDKTLEDGRKSTAIFTGVRHPNFPEDDVEDGYDPGCMECGARAGYRCTCDDEPWNCEECGGGDGAYGCQC